MTDTKMPSFVVLNADDAETAQSLPYADLARRCRARLDKVDKMLRMAEEIGAIAASFEDAKAEDRMLLAGADMLLEVARHLGLAEESNARRVTDPVVRPVVGEIRNIEDGSPAQHVCQKCYAIFYGDDCFRLALENFAYPKRLCASCYPKEWV